MAKTKNEVIEEIAEIDETAALKEELESLKAELKATKANLEAAKAPKVEENMDEYEEVFIPDDGLDHASRFISVNGENVLAQPGEYVTMKKPLAMILKASIREEQEAKKRRDKAKRALQNS
jgi:hypothetical protein